MDLSQFNTQEKSEKGAKLHLAGPDGTLLYDEESKKRLKKQLGRRNQLHLTAEEMDNETLDILVKCTLSWEHIVVSAARPPCTAENVRNLYRTYPWIREQVDEFIGDRSNFLGN
jgi:hypothetical protein